MFYVYVRSWKVIIFVLRLFKVMEGYGQTEGTAGITFTIPGDCSSGLYILLLKLYMKCIISLIGDVWSHKTSLTPPRLLHYILFLRNEILYTK